MKNENFCYAPWMHLYTNPDSRLLPCCLFHEDNTEFPNLNYVPLEEAINHPKMIKLRKELLAGEKPAGCYRCEAQSKMNMTPYREKMNNYGRKQNIPLNEDGTVDIKDFNPPFLDIRFGNLCNLKCRTCSPTFSSSIAVEFNKINNTKLQVLHSLNDNVIEEIFSKLDKVEHIYLAGGEPLIEENNYTLLSELIKRNLKPSLLYNTNLTNIKFKDKNLSDLWKHFPEVNLTVSLDGYMEVNDYIRYGSSYEQIMENILSIRNDAPHVKFNINTVASMMSMHSLPELGKDILNRGICRPDEIVFSICHHPDELDPTVLTNEAKEEVSKLFMEYIDWIKSTYNKLPESKYGEVLINKCLGLLAHMNSSDNSHLISVAIEKLKEQDNFRNTDYRKVLKI